MCDYRIARTPLGLFLKQHLKALNSVEKSSDLAFIIRAVLTILFTKAMIKQRLCLSMKHYAFYLYSPNQRNHEEFKAVLQFLLVNLVEEEQEAVVLQVS